MLKKKQKSELLLAVEERMTSWRWEQQSKLGTRHKAFRVNLLDYLRPLMLHAPPWPRRTQMAVLKIATFSYA